jgi:hypothetical protein
MFFFMDAPLRLQVCVKDVRLAEITSSARSRSLGDQHAAHTQDPKQVAAVDALMNVS